MFTRTAMAALLMVPLGGTALAQQNSSVVPTAAQIQVSSPEAEKAAPVRLVNPQYCAEVVPELVEIAKKVARSCSPHNPVLYCGSSKRDLRDTVYNLARGATRLPCKLLPGINKISDHCGRQEGTGLSFALDFEVKGCSQDVTVNRTNAFMPGHARGYTGMSHIHVQVNPLRERRTSPWTQPDMAAVIAAAGGKIELPSTNPHIGKPTKYAQAGAKPTKITQVKTKPHRTKDGKNIGGKSYDIAWANKGEIWGRN